jgi:hypothetical protein
MAKFPGKFAGGPCFPVSACFFLISFDRCS